MKTEDAFVAELNLTEKELAEARLKLKKARDAVWDAETVFINTKLKHERLTEEYRIFRNQKVRPLD